MMFELKDNNFRLGSIILVTSSAFMLVFFSSFHGGRLFILENKT